MYRLLFSVLAVVLSLAAIGNKIWHMGYDSAATTYESAAKDAKIKADADRANMQTGFNKIQSDLQSTIAAKESENEDLRHKYLNAGSGGLRIKAVCPSAAEPAPGPAGTDGQTAVLSTDAGQAVFDIRSNIIRNEEQLNKCIDVLQRIEDAQNDTSARAERKPDS